MKNIKIFMIAALLCVSAHVLAQEEVEPPVDEVSPETVAKSWDELAEDEEDEDYELEEDSAEELTVEAPVEPSPQAVSVPSVPVVPVTVTVTDEPAPISDKPRIAVYVTGGDDPAKAKALGTYILNAIAGTNRYTPIERSEAFLAEITSEQVTQRSGRIDDSQISRLGMQAGVQYICVADITEVLKGFQVSARILNVETAEVVTVGVSTSALNTIDDLKNASNDVVIAMFRKLYPQDYPIEESVKKRFRFGGRAGYNSSYVEGLSLTLVDYGPHTGERKQYKPHKSKPGLGGSGFELSAVVKMAITDDAVFSLSPGFVMRTPYNTDAAKISEFAVSIPALFEWRLFRSPVSVVGGVQMDIPFSTEILWADEDEAEPLDIRPPQDFGLVLGVSVQILYNLAIDIRGCAGVSEFDKGNSHFMRQLSVGVSYLY